MTGPKQYLSQLADDFGAGWNRFWFTASDPLTLGLIRFLSGLMALGLYLSYLPDLEYYLAPQVLFRATWPGICAERSGCFRSSTTRARRVRCGACIGSAPRPSPCSRPGCSRG